MTIPVTFSDGKAPELEHARSSAVWPDGTLAELQDENVLMERLPSLMVEFKRIVESFGFTY